LHYQERPYASSGCARQSGGGQGRGDSEGCGKFKGVKMKKQGILIVRLKEDDPHFKLKKGDVFEAQIYWLDPEKITLFRRLSDDFDPQCNQYRHAVEILFSHCQKIQKK